jgi:hypothetical protein
MSHLNQIRNKILSSNSKLSQRLKMIFCLLLICSGLLLFSKGVTTAYLQGEQCRPIICQTGSCGNFDLHPVCEADRTGCTLPKKCRMHYGRCSNSTPQDPIRCAGSYCSGSCLSEF